MSKSTMMSAKDRVLSLVDENSFVEIGAMVTKRNTDFNLQEKSVPGDGVITGYGLVNGSIVYVYSQDAAAMNGTMGEMHAKKIVRMYDMAMKVGAPVVGLIDCAGLRLQEATDALAGFGEIYAKQVQASGVVPQISVIMGTCGGGVAVSSTLSDFTFMSQDAKLFVNAPNTIDGNYVDKCDTAAADFQKNASTVDFVFEGEAETLVAVRELLSVLPANNENDAFADETNDDLNRDVTAFAVKNADPSDVCKDIADNGRFFEIKPGYAKDMVIGLMQLNGITIGAVANRESVLTSAGCDKAASFVKFCDAYNIPVFTLTNVTGYASTVEEEKTIASAAGRLTFSFADADVAKVNVIVGDAMGSAYITMNSKHIGADLVFALEDVKIGMMNAQSAAKIISEDGGEAAASEYDKLQTAEAAAKRGYVDQVIDAASIRKQLIYAFEMLYSKREVRLSKKHGTI